MRSFKLAAAVVITASLAACGGASGPIIDSSGTRGSLVENPPPLFSMSIADGSKTSTLDPVLFGKMLEAAKAGTTQVTGVPKCAITSYSMKYGTIGGAGEITNSSGAILVPSGTDAACSGPRPVLLYAHGTTADKANNMADLTGNAEASLVAAHFAAQGFIVVAPNYAGYNTSALSYHPYLNAEQQASDMIDSLRAARKAFDKIGTKESGKLFITGYSQGGHVAMATQRAMQSATYSSEFKVTALAGLSGPYALASLVDAAFAGSPNLGITLFLPLITTSWQKSYGGVYTTPSDIYESQYATGIETLLPGSLTLTQLFMQGKLPQSALFAKTSLPQSAGFSVFFGDGNLVKTSYRNQYLADAVQFPCGVNAGDPLNCTPANALRKGNVKNDLRTYVPNVPVLLCGGNGDPTVFFAASTLATASYFTQKGMPAATLTVLDVDSASTGTTDPFAALKGGFAQAKAATAAAAGTDPVAQATAVLTAYHAGLVPPFCLASARGFFQSKQ